MRLLKNSCHVLNLNTSMSIYTYKHFLYFQTINVNQIIDRYFLIYVHILFLVKAFSISIWRIFFLSNMQKTLEEFSLPKKLQLLAFLSSWNQQKLDFNSFNVMLIIVLKPAYSKIYGLLLIIRCPPYRSIYQIIINELLSSLVVIPIE